MSENGQNQSQPQNPAGRDFRDDEIDLGELVRNIWNTKWRVLISLLVVSALFVSYLAASFLTASNSSRYEQVFDLTFAGLSDGQFPDGSRFVMSDMISPTVLGRVFRSNELHEYGFTLDGFRRAVNIEPYSPDYFLIRARYQQLLSGNDLGASEIDALQERMRSEMSLAQSGGVRLSLQLPADQQMPAGVAQKVLMDIASTWATRAIDERGVLRLNLPVYSARIFDEGRFEELDYLIGIELLLDNIALIEGNVAELKRQPNSANIVDQESGFNLEDLEKSIRDVAQYDLRQLIDPVKELGLTRNENVVRLFYNRQLQEMGLQRRFWEQRAEVTREVLATYSRDEVRSGATEDLPSGGQGGGMTPQLGDAFLDRLVDISRQGGEQEFRQALTRQVLEYENDALDIGQEMEAIQLTLNAIDGTGETSNDSELRAAYLQEVQSSLPTVLATLRDYTDIIGRLHEQLGRQAAGSVSEIIMPQGGSFQVVTASPVERRHIMILIALLVLTGFVSLFGSLMYDMLKRRNKAT